MLRIDGNLLPMDITPIDTDGIMQMLRFVMDDTDYHQWQHNLEHDFVLSLDGIARFRVNVFFRHTVQRLFSGDKNTHSQPTTVKL